MRAVGRGPLIVDVGRGQHDPIRAGGRVVELLVEHVIDLLPRAGLDHERVAERLHREGLRVRDFSGLLAAADLVEQQPGAHSARVHERRHGTTVLCVHPVCTPPDMTGLQQPTWIMPGVFGARWPWRSLMASSWTWVSSPCGFAAAATPGRASTATSTRTLASRPPSGHR